MNDDARCFLIALLESHGSPGHESGVQELFRARLKACDLLQTDVLGSVMACVNPEGTPRLLLDGHSDEIGFQVHYIDEGGFLYARASGLWDAEVPVGQRVIAHTRSGPLPGVIGKEAVHLAGPDEQRQRLNRDPVVIDIGARDGEQARAHVRIGDSVTMAARFVEVMEGRAVAKAFDNRAGIFVVAETMRSLLRTRPKAAVIGLSSVQEEIGMRGAAAAAWSVSPEVAVVVDATHATDHPAGDKLKSGDIRLGGGPVLCRGPNINPKVFERLLELAEREAIPIQIEAAPHGTSTNANPIQLTRAGVATGLVSLPLRYMHSPCEMAALSDISSAVRLLTAFALSLEEGESWIPGV